MLKKIEEAFKLIAYPVFIYLNINIEIIAILCVLMIIDSTVGPGAAVRIGEQFKFKKLIWGMILKIMTLGIPITVALMGKGLGYDLSMLVDWSIKIMILSEAYSILGNIYSIKTKKPVKDIDFLSLLLQGLRGFIYKNVKKIISYIEDSGDCGEKTKKDGDS